MISTYISTHLEGSGDRPLRPSVPPKIRVASMMRTSISGSTRVTIEKKMPRNLKTGIRKAVHSRPPKMVARGIVIKGGQPQ